MSYIQCVCSFTFIWWKDHRHSLLEKNDMKYILFNLFESISLCITISSNILLFEFFLSFYMKYGQEVYIDSYANKLTSSLNIIRKKNKKKRNKWKIFALIHILPTTVVVIAIRHRLYGSNWKVSKNYYTLSRGRVIQIALLLVLLFFSLYCDRIVQRKILIRMISMNGDQ